MKSPAVYILASKPRGTLYVGVTSDLVRRIWQHREGVYDGFSRRYGIRTLVWYQLHSTMMAAIRREKALKGWSRRRKIALISSENGEWRDLWTEITGAR